MFLAYFQQNYMTILLSLALGVIAYAYHTYTIPARSYIPLIILIILLCSFTYFLNDWIYSCYRSEASMDPSLYVPIRKALSIMNYILQPIPIMLQLFIIVPDKKKHLRISIPAQINTIISLISPLTGGLVFEISEDGHFNRGPLGLTVYAVSITYTLFLLIVSVMHFKDNNRRKGLIILCIFLLMVQASILEYYGILPGIVDEISILSVLLYFFYLIITYQEELKTTLAEQELRITESRLFLLQEQMRPHFLFNSLGIIRSLVKKDKDRAIEAIDNFSDYLRVHVTALKDPGVVPFEKELEHVNSILAMVRSDYTKNIRIDYDLRYTNFRIPPLTLEPIVENAIKYGLNETGGTILISSDRIVSEDGTAEIVVRVMDSGGGTEDVTVTEQKRLGIGLENTRTRLQLRCNADLSFERSEKGFVAEIRIPESQQETGGTTE